MQRLADDISEDWTKIGEHLAVSKPEYTFELGEFRRGADQMIFVHLNVHKWSLSVLKLMIADFKKFRECVTCPLYATADVDDEKWSSFVGLLGFKFLMNVICKNGERRRLFIHLKENPSVVLVKANNRLNSELHDEPLGRTDPLP